MESINIELANKKLKIIKFINKYYILNVYKHKFPNYHIQ